jgi:hypothetical protein
MLRVPQQTLIEYQYIADFHVGSLLALSSAFVLQRWPKA